MRIGLTQVGDARPHHQKCIFHCASSDRVFAGIVAMLAVAVAEDEEVADFVIDITEGQLVTQGVTEGNP